jgi:uncharacterized protein with FMN-binding domain
MVSMSNARLDSTFPPPAPPTATIDPEVDERLARLAARRAGTAPTSRTNASRTNASRTNASTATSAVASAGPARRTRKRHAAKGSRAAAVMLSVGTAAGLSAYFQHVDAASAAATGSSTTATASASVATGTSTGTGTSATTSASSAATGLADGVYTGATDTNKWGPVQVQVTVSGGQITDVVALQTPSADRKSVSINSRATPVLASETITAQSADIDTVSGATYTTNSYKVSLQSALDLARATAVQAGASA